MGKWYQGKVVDFDSLSGKHRVSFRDGDEKRCMLRQEALVWLDIPELSSEAAIKRMRQEEGEPIATAVIRDDENQAPVEGGANCSREDDSMSANVNATTVPKAVMPNVRSGLLTNRAKGASNRKHAAIGKAAGAKALGNKVRVCNGKAALKTTGVVKPTKAPTARQEHPSSARSLAGAPVLNGKATAKSGTLHKGKPRDGRKAKKPGQAEKSSPGKSCPAAASRPTNSEAKTAASGSKESPVLNHTGDTDYEEPAKGAIAFDDSKSASSSSNEAEKAPTDKKKKFGDLPASPKCKTLAGPAAIKGGAKVMKPKETKGQKRSRLGLSPPAASQQPELSAPESKQQAVAKPSTGKAVGPASPASPGAAAGKLGRRPKKGREESRAELRRLKTAADAAFEVAAQAVLGARIGVWWEDDACFYKGKVVAHDWYHKRLRVLYDDGVEESISPLKQETQFTWLLPRARTAGATDAVHSAFQLLQAANAGCQVPAAEAAAGAGGQEKAAAAVPHTADGSHLDALVPLQPSSAGGREGDAGRATGSGQPVMSATPHPVDSTTRAVSNLGSGKQSTFLATQLKPSAGCNLTPLTGLQAMVPSSSVTHPASLNPTGSQPQSHAKGCASAAARKLAAAESFPVSPSPMAGQPPPQGVAAEGWKVSIVFRGDKQIFQGRVLSWDKARKQHHVLWDDGEDEWLDAREEQLGWHADRLKTAGFSAGLPPGIEEPKGHSLEGWRIAVYWKEEQQFYQGTVEEYDAELDQHTVSYCDGDELCESLQGLVFKYVLPPTVQPVASRRLPGRKCVESGEREEPERRPRRRARAALEESEEESEEWGKAPPKPSQRHASFPREPSVLTPRVSDIRRLNSKQGSLLIFEGEDNHINVSPAASPTKAAILPALLRPALDSRGQPLLVRRISSLKSSQGFRVGVKRVRVYLPGVAEAKPVKSEAEAAAEDVAPQRVQPKLQLMLERVTAAQHSIQSGLPGGALPEPAAHADPLDTPADDRALRDPAGAPELEPPALDDIAQPEQQAVERMDFEIGLPPESCFEGTNMEALGPEDCPEMSEETSREASECGGRPLGTSCRQECLRQPPGSMSLPPTPSANSEALPEGPSRTGSHLSGPAALCRAPN